MKTTPWEVVGSRISDAYLAGFLDGDGSIVAAICKQDSKRYPNKPYRIILKINFTQHIRHEVLLMAIRKFLGVGSIRRIPSHNLSELVIVKKGDIEGILNRMVSHLLLKRKQALIALRMIKIFKNCKRIKKNAIAPHDFARLLSMAMEIRKLNSGTGGKNSHKLINPVTTQV